MIHIYKVGSDDYYCYEAYKSVIGEPWNEVFVRTLENKNELDLYLDILRVKGLDFVIHNDEEEYDEYHVALPSV